MGHFALVLGLFDMLVDGRATIVNVASCAQWLIVDQSPLAERLAASVADPKAAAAGATTVKPAGAGWPRYCDSKAANVAFTLATSRKYGAVLRSVAYHPGVMATDLWASDDGGGGDGGPAAEATCLGKTRLGCALFVKHPSISGAGAAALAAPRCGWTDCRDNADCCAYCCASGADGAGHAGGAGAPLLHTFVGRCLAAVISGDGGCVLVMKPTASRHLLDSRTP